MVSPDPPLNILNLDNVKTLIQHEETIENGDTGVFISYYHKQYKIVV